MENLRLLVFGKTGQVATCLGNRNSDHIQIDCFGRNECDITNFEAVQHLIETTRPNFVVNAAAYTAVDKAESESELAFLVNRDGSANIAKATAAHNIPLIHFSTDYVFSGSKKTPYQETDDVGPTGIYGLSKLAGEQVVAAINPKHIILRTAWVYSAHGNNFLKTMLRLAQERDELTIVADQFGNPSDAEDLADAVIAIISKINKNPSFNDYGIFNLCGPERMNWADFAREIFNASRKLGGVFATVRNIPTSDYPTPARRPANSSLDCGKFHEVFNYTHIPLKTSVNTTVKKLLQSVNR